MKDEHLRRQALRLAHPAGIDTLDLDQVRGIVGVRVQHQQQVVGLAAARMR
ncbi:MAG: hypothetical protein ACJ747_02005 [Gaiellaceae bacterium]